MLYVAAKCASDSTFGATKLNKILFYSDFIAFANLGEAITGATYQKLPRGPAPKQLLPVLKELEREGEAAIARRSHLGFTQKRLVPLRDPDVSLFSAPELKLVNEVIEALWGRSATEVSELSHLARGWQIVEANEEIPYWTVFIDQDQTLSPDDVLWGQSIAAEHGLSSAS
jgi:Protein of unknown function (DUF4065)